MKIGENYPLTSTSMDVIIENDLIPEPVLLNILQLIMRKPMEWNEYWSNLITKEKLISKVTEINEIDKEINGKCSIEDICHSIYNEYKKYAEQLENARHELLKIIEQFPGVHLQTSRVKKVDSVLCKIIIKKHAHMMDENSLYSDITDKNYKDILTDLIGIRLIISYRGKWIDLHQKIVKTFPYAENRELYNQYVFLPHPTDGSRILAEIPKAYYAYGDDLSLYDDVLVERKIKDNGYRSVHYVVSFMNTYVEIQTRTIYDDAILVEKEGLYIVKMGFDLKTEDVFKKVKCAQDLLEKFNERIVNLGGENHEG